MSKRGRPKSRISLTTGEDRTLWRYASLGEALKANVDVLADLLQLSDLPRVQSTQRATDKPQPVKLPAPKEAAS